MRYIAVITLLLAVLSASGQIECKVDSLPCYQYYLDVEEISGVERTPKRWRAYKRTIEEVYQSDSTFHSWKWNLGEGEFVHISAIILTYPERPYTVLEKMEWDWGGKFYSRDFRVITEALFQQMDDPFPK